MATKEIWDAGIKGQVRSHTPRYFSPLMKIFVAIFIISILAALVLLVCALYFSIDIP